MEMRARGQILRPQANRRTAAFGENIMKRQLSEMMDPQSVEVIEMAKAYAVNERKKEIGVEHILLGLFRHGDCRAMNLLERAGINTHDLFADLIREYSAMRLDDVTARVRATIRPKKTTKK